MRNNILLFLFFVFNLLTSYAQVNNAPGIPSIINYLPVDYSAGCQNWCVTQDERGVMYFGNSQGLLEFDGRNWKTIKTLKNLVIHAIEIAPDGSILYGSYDEFGYLSPDSTGNLIFHDYFSEFKLKDYHFDDINNIFYTPFGIVYQGYYGLFIKKENGYAVIPVKDDIITYSAFINNQLFLGLNNRGLCKIENDSIITVPCGQLFKGDNIKAILPYRDSSLIICSSSRNFTEYHFLTTQKPFVTASKLSRLSTYLGDKNIRCGIKTSNNLFVFGTNRNGIIIADSNGEIIKELNQQKGLPTNIVFDIFSDQQGNLWASLDNGISMIEVNSPFTYLNQNLNVLSYGLSIGKRKSSNAETHPEYVIGTADGLYLSTGEKFNMSFKKSSTYLRFTFNHFQDDGKTYFTSQNRVYELKDTCPKVALATEDANLSIRRMKYHPEYILLGDNGIKLLKNERGKLKIKKALRGYNKSCICIQEEDSNSIWVGQGGIASEKLTYNLQLDSIIQVKAYGIQYGLPTTNYVLPMPFGDSVIFTTEKGLYKYNNEKDFFYPSFLNKYLNGGKVNAVAKDKKGNVFVIEGNDKKMLVKQNDSRFKVLVEPFYKVQKNFITDIFLIQADKDTTGVAENVFFAYENGFICFNPLMSDSYKKPFKTLIRKVYCSGRKDSLKVVFNGSFSNQNHQICASQDIGQQAKFMYSTNSIGFEYSSCFYENIDAIEYSVMLDGFDMAWGEWSRDAKKEYSNLHEGGYVFKVKARNIYRIESPVECYSFAVLAPWYRTFWAYLVYLILLTGIVYLIVRLYNRKLIIDKQRLEQVVKDRTLEIVNQKEEIETQAEMLKSTNIQLTELGSFKESLSSMIVHDLKNPLTSIIGLSDLNANETNNRERLKSNNQLIFMSGQQMLTMVLNLLDIQKCENASLSLQFESIALDKVATAALEQTRYLSETKHIQIHYQIQPDILVTIDRDIIQRVFINLIANSIKCTSVNGTIRISCQFDFENTNFLKIFVEDNGRGIDEDIQERIFDKFFYSKKHQQEEYHSSGLGLPFCKMAIEAHGGSIGVKSAIDKGTIIWFTIPVSEITSKTKHDAGIDSYNTRKFPFQLTSDEKEYLNTYSIQLQELKFYQITEIRALLSRIDSNNQNISLWKKSVEDAAFTSNEVYFKQLISTIE